MLSVLMYVKNCIQLSLLQNDLILFKETLMRYKCELIFLSFEKTNSDQYYYPMGIAKMHHYSLM